MRRGNERFPERSRRAPLADGDPEPRSSRDRRPDGRADEPLPIREDRDPLERRDASDPDLGAEGWSRERD